MLKEILPQTSDLILFPSSLPHRVKKFNNNNGMVDAKFLREKRKYVVVMIFAAAALLTPPDPITQIGLAIPLLILYELSIFSVNIIEKKNKKDA